MTDLTTTLQDLPLAAFTPVALMIIVGIVLWAAGRRILRAGFAIVGLLAGAAIGFALGEHPALGLAPWVAAILGAIVVACIFALAYRIAVALSMGAVLAVAAPLCVLAVASLQAGERADEGQAKDATTEEVRDSISDWLAQHEQTLKDATDAVKRSSDEAIERSGLRESASEQIEELRGYGSRVMEGLHAEWEKTPPALRPKLKLAAVIGALAGIVLGLLARRFSDSAITALGGSLLWLTGLRILAVRMGIGDQPWLPSSAVGFMALWLAAAFIGLGIQWTFSRRRVDKQA